MTTLRQLGKRDGLRYTITWLHRRANSMNDPQAKAILNSAAFDLGLEIREGHVPPIRETDDMERRLAAIASAAPDPAKPEPKVAGLTEADLIDIHLGFVALDQTDPRVAEKQQQIVYRLRKEGKLT